MQHMLHGIINKIMKKISEFFDKGPYWQVFFVGFIFTGALTFTMFNYLTDAKFINVVVNIKISIAMGVIFGLMFASMNYLSRCSIKFWAAARELEQEIDAITKKDDMINLSETKFQALRKMASGTPHYSELHRLWAIMQTHIKFLK